MQDQQQAISDSLQSSENISTAYDSIWAGADIPTQAPSQLEQIMLSYEKIYVVLAVVLIIWFGIVFFLHRTDKRISNLEQSLGDRIHDDDDL